MNKQLRFSIIIASFNAGGQINETLDSIVKQSKGDSELIIIDGGSKDNTTEVIRQYENYVDYWISEPDKGIYDAWNKGLEKATGDWIMFLGSDDVLMPHAIISYNEFISKLAGDVEYISSKVQMVDKWKVPVRIKGWAWEWPGFLKDMIVAHPGSLHSRKLFEKYGKFNVEYKIVGDYELLLRAKENLKAAFFDYVTVTMQEGGTSDSIRAVKEHFIAATQTGGYPKGKAFINAIYVAGKFSVKNALRKVGINAYLKK